MNETMQPVGDDGTTPPPVATETLFRVMYDAGLQAVGEPMRRGTGRLRIEITPTQMVRLLQELSSRAVTALMLVLEHGYRPGKRIEIEGWSARWLMEHGMARTTAEKAAAELRDKGYVRSERMPGSNTPLGRKLGVVPSGIVEEVEDVPGVLRNDGRPVTNQQRPQPYLPRLVDSAESRNSASSVDEPENDPVSAPHRNSTSPEPRDGDNVDVFPQVSAVSPEYRKGSSTAPSSSGSSESSEEVFSVPGPGHPLTRDALTRFFAQPALIVNARAQWEVVVALIAREFTANPTRCAELIQWLGEGEDEHPPTRLAQMVVDLVTTPPPERPTVASDQGAFLRSRGVKFAAAPPDDFIAMFVTSMVTSLDSSRKIDSWGGWFGAGLKRGEQFQGKVLAGTLAVFRRLIDSPDGLSSSQPRAEVVEAVPTTYNATDPSYVERLRAAAQGTNWEDDISFEMLLRNPAQQARVLMAHERRQHGG